MVILIFFMASAAFMGDEWFLRAAIPFEFGRGTATDRAADPLEIPPDRLEVVMETDGAGRTLVSFLEIAGGSIEQFERRVGAFPRSAETANLEVVIKAAPGVPYREVIRVHSALDRAGVVKIGVSVKQAPAPGGDRRIAGVADAVSVCTNTARFRSTCSGLPARAWRPERVTRRAAKPAWGSARRATQSRTSKTVPGRTISRLHRPARPGLARRDRPGGP